MSALGYLLLNAVQAIFLVAWSVLWMTVSILLSVVSRDAPLWIARRVWAPGLIAGSLVSLEVEMRGRLDPARPYFFVMNHESMFDIAVAFVAIPRYLRFVAKEVLRWVPFLGLYMTRAGMIFVNRRNPRSAYRALARAVDRLRDGDCFIAYPEGTRSTDGRVHPFKRGPFVTAVKAGAAIVPVAISGSGRVLPRGTFALRPGPVRVAVGEPIPTEGLVEDDVPELIQRAHAAVVELHRELGGAMTTTTAAAAPVLGGVGRVGRAHEPR